MKDKVEQLFEDYRLQQKTLTEVKAEILRLFSVSKRFCNKSCSQSDWYKGGKCDENGCYHK